jgi:L-alanine-DL-glutamate epimerase-like enolase superfamily enzyme
MKNTVIQSIEVTKLNARLNQPFRIATGQHDTLENVLLTLELEDGSRGYGEAAVATHITGETVEETLHNLESLKHELIGRDISDYLRLSAELNERLSKNQCALAAAEMALLDALTRQWKMPLWKFFGANCRPFTTDITIVLGTVEEAKTSAKAYYRKGFRAFKIKIGKNPDEDFERVLQVHQLTRKSPIYLDANQAYAAEEALKFLKKLRQAGIKPALIEQPVSKNDWEGLAKVSRESKVLVLADESVSSLKDAAHIIHKKICGAINIKLMKFGVFQAREIARLAQAAGIQLMIGAMMESPLSCTVSAHLAAGIGGFDFIDLDTPFFIKDKLMKGSPLTSNGVYDLRKIKTGIGVVPSPIKVGHV